MNSKSLLPACAAACLLAPGCHPGALGRPARDIWPSASWDVVGPQADAILSGAPILATSIGAPVDDYEGDTRRYGQRLDFSIWYSP